MAAADAFQGEPAAAERSIALQRGDRIGRAARLVAAAWRQHFRRAELPAASNQNEQPGDHRRALSSALSSSVRSRLNSRSMPFDRPIITWSAPGMPLSGMISRA